MTTHRYIINFLLISQQMTTLAFLIILFFQLTDLLYMMPNIFLRDKKLYKNNPRNRLWLGSLVI